MDTTTVIGTLFDGTGYLGGDIALAFLITMSAILTYLRIGFDASKMRMTWARMSIGVGFTIWSGRFWQAIFTGYDLLVTPVSLVAITMITAGYSAVQIRAIRRAIVISKTPVVCINDPTYPCQREDRILDAVERATRSIG